LGKGLKTLIGIAVAALFVLIISLFVFTWGSTERDEYGLVYSAGPIEGQHFQTFVAPGSSLKFLGILDYMDTLPANQRTYIVGDKGDDVTHPIVVTDGKGVELGFKTSSTFELVNDPAKLDTLNIQVCTKYDGCDDEGWQMMLNDYYRKAQESALQTVARQYNTDELMQGDLSEFNQKVAKETQEKVAQNMGDNYLTDVTFQIQRPIAPHAVQEQYDNIKAASLQTEVRKQEVQQAEQQANAAEKLSEVTKNPNYIEWQRTEALKDAVAKGQVEFWVLPETSQVDINK
jgi:hypothetical protein